MGVGILQGEVRLGARQVFPGMRSMDIGAGGWIGAGHAQRRDNHLEPVWGSCDDAIRACERATVLWTGAQLVVYAVGSFTHGMQIGVEASWMQLWVTKSAGSLYYNVAQLLGAPPPADRQESAGAFMTGPVFGYKYVTSFGLTVNPQIAAGPIVTTRGDIAIAPRLALNAGWTF